MKTGSKISYFGQEDKYMAIFESYTYFCYICEV